MFPEPPSSNRKPRVLIIGAGFGGMTVALHLRGKIEAEVTLVSYRNFHLFTPLLYQTATGIIDTNHLAQAVRPHARAHGFRFIEGEVTSIDMAARKVHARFGDLVYDYLVLAVGSESNDYGIKGVAEHALSLMTIYDGEVMHNKIVGAMETASTEKDEAARRALLTFAVIGAGPTGVELTGSIRDFVNLMLKDYPEITDLPRVLVIEALPTVLPGLSDYVVRKTTDVLTKRGILVRTSSKVVEVGERGILLENGELIESANVFWMAGVKPSKLVESLQVDKQRGRVIVDSFLRVNGHSEVFALGDMAYVLDAKTGKKLPENAQVAVQEGKWLAKALPHLIAGAEVTPFTYHDRGFMLSLGRNVGVVDAGWIKVTGFFGWLIWRVVHLSMISASRNRVSVILDWSLSYLNRRNIAHSEV